MPPPSRNTTLRSPRTQTQAPTRTSLALDVEDDYSLPEDSLDNARSWTQESGTDEAVARIRQKLITAHQATLRLKKGNTPTTTTLPTTRPVHNNDQDYLETENVGNRQLYSNTQANDDDDDAHDYINAQMITAAMKTSKVFHANPDHHAPTHSNTNSAKPNHPNHSNHPNPHPNHPHPGQRDVKSSDDHDYVNTSDFDAALPPLPHQRNLPPPPQQQQHHQQQQQQPPQQQQSHSQSQSQAQPKPLLRPRTSSQTSTQSTQSQSESPKPPLRARTSSQTSTHSVQSTQSYAPSRSSTLTSVASNDYYNSRDVAAALDDDYEVPVDNIASQPRDDTDYEKLERETNDYMNNDAIHVAEFSDLLRKMSANATPKQSESIDEMRERLDSNAEEDRKKKQEKQKTLFRKNQTGKKDKISTTHCSTCKAKHEHCICGDEDQKKRMKSIKLRSGDSHPGVRM